MGFFKALFWRLFGKYRTPKIDRETARIQIRAIMLQATRDAKEFMPPEVA